MKSLKEKIQMVQLAFGTIVKGRKNDYHNSEYFDINDLLEQLEPILEEQRIVLTQPLRGDKVFSILTDLDSSETEESYLDVPGGLTNPQHVGSVVSYFRRYTLTALLATRSEKDDDANAASIKAEPEKVWLTKDQFEASKKGTPQQIRNVLATFKTNTHAMKKAYREELESILNKSN